MNAMNMYVSVCSISPPASCVECSLLAYHFAEYALHAKNLSHECDITALTPDLARCPGEA